MNKKYKISIGIVIFLILLSLTKPTIPMAQPKHYTKKQLEEMRVLAKKNDDTAIRKLFFYYVSNHNSYNAKLMQCKMSQKKGLAHYFDVKYDINESEENTWECPEKPLDFLEDHYYANYLNLIHYIFAAHKFPKFSDEHK